MVALSEAFDRMRKKKKSNPGKVGIVMREFKKGTLHSGSDAGPVVTNRRQAIAIALSEAGLSRKKWMRK